MVSPLLGLLLVVSVTADYYIYNGVNPYDWESPDKLLYDYHGLVNPTVNKTIEDFTWSSAAPTISLLEPDTDPLSLYTKKPLAGDSTSSIVSWNETYNSEFAGTIGVPRYPLEAAIASQVVQKSYIIPCYDSPSLGDVDSSGYKKSVAYSGTVRLAPPPSFIANATIAFLQKYNVKNTVESVGISILMEQYSGNVPLGTAIKNKIKATYGSWLVSEYTFDSDSLSGVTSAKDYFFGTYKSKFEALTDTVSQATDSSRILIVIGGPEFIRYVAHALQETLEAKDGAKGLNYNEWIILAVPSNLNPELPAYSAADLMEVKMDTFDAENDLEVRQAYQSMFVLSDDIADANYQDMATYAIDHFGDEFNSTDNFLFPWTPNRKVPNWVGYYKDSYLLYLYMMENHPSDPSTWVSEMISKGTFTASDFGEEPYLSTIEIDQYGDRKWKLNFNHYNSNQAWTKVATFKSDLDNAAVNQIYKEVVAIKNIAWPEGKDEPPQYIPDCGTYKKCPVTFTDGTRNLLIAVVCLVVVFVIALPLFFHCYRKSQYEMELNNMGWRIGPEELQSTKKDIDEYESDDGSMAGSVKSLAAELGEDDNEADHGHHENKAMYSNTLVALKQVMKKHFGIVTRDLMIEMKKLRDMRDEYIVSVVGLCIDLDSSWLIMEDCSKGTLESVLEDETTELDSNFKLNMIEDIAKGVYFIHQKLGSHGYLKTSNVLVSKHFTMKVADFGEHVFSSDMNRIHGLPELERNQRLLWRAPELVRMRNIPMNGTKAGDSYSFAIIVHEIINRQGPFNLNSIDNEETPTSIILKIKSGEVKRPEFSSGLKYKPLLKCKSLTMKCWDEEAGARPQFKKIVANLKVIKPGKSAGTFLDTAVKRLEKYSITVEHAAVEKEKLAASEQKKVDDIMECFVPKSLGKQESGEFEPSTVGDCTVAVIELTGCNTSPMSKDLAEVIAMDTAFHAHIDKKRRFFEKVDIGAVNKVALLSRVCNEKSPHNKGLVKTVVMILQDLEKEMRDKNMSKVMSVRAGIHTGFIKTGIVGDTFSSVQRFGVLGPTMSYADSLCSTCESWEMLVSPATHKLVQEDRHDQVVMEFGAKGNYSDAGQKLEAYVLKTDCVQFAVQHKEDKKARKPSVSVPKKASGFVSKAAEAAASAPQMAQVEEAEAEAPPMSKAEEAGEE